MKKALMTLLLLTLPCQAMAQVVTGYAPFDGDVQRAAMVAEREALRSLVEEKLGVQVKSTTMVNNGAVVRDSILARADGYVQIKKRLGQGQSGGLYYVTLDAEVNQQKINVAMQEVPQLLQQLDMDATRSGINVAIVDLDAQRGDSSSLNFFIGVLKNAGFRAEANDQVISYLAAYGPQANAVEVRRIGRLGDRFGANSIIRGSVSLASKGRMLPPVGKQVVYEAVANVNCELLGYDNNAVDVYAKYHKAIAGSVAEAERRAKELALEAAAQELARQAVATTQDENRGGVRNVRTTLVFTGQPAAYERQIRAALENAYCRILRSGYRNGSYQLFIESNAYSNLDELKNGIKDILQQNVPHVQEGNEGENIGSTRLNFII